MKEAQIFNFGDEEIKTLVINYEPYFVGKDVAEVLGYSNTSKAIRDHVDDEDKLTERIVLAGQNREVVLINESGLYSLVLKSKLPSAKQFKRWVTKEVLPTIRKHGAYLTDQKALDITTNPNSLADLLLQAGEQLKQKDLVIQEMKPKALFADTVAASHTSILIGELAKLIKQGGYDIGSKRLFHWLRENGFLIKRQGTEYNMPTQKSMDLGLFEIKEGSRTDAGGVTHITKTTKVTGKGQQYFINKFLSKNEIA